MATVKATFKVKVDTMAKVKLFFAVIAKKLGMDSLKSILTGPAKRNIHLTKV